MSRPIDNLRYHFSSAIPSIWGEEWESGSPSDSESTLIGHGGQRSILLLLRMTSAGDYKQLLKKLCWSDWTTSSWTHPLPTVLFLQRPIKVFFLFLESQIMHKQDKRPSLSAHSQSLESPICLPLSRVQPLDLLYASHSKLPFDSGTILSLFIIVWLFYLLLLIC